MEEQKEDFSSKGGEWTMVRIIEACVSVIRRAQGKKNPDEVQFGTPEWHQVADEFVRDVYRGLGGDPNESAEEDNSWFGVGG
ncbi:MAG: hypothetical protein EPN70_18025 [Paraburkholderia sp.]|uniref:hypothetical protein n=1 Tax=Paraburkholderia sp. TaxID=1926495 RepID=UPI001204150E|nr:hypothetical protein [Paraburkholderia sp.]TAM02032.1 MAG: hypothetical protein EPN70_18025 [Paraburkholderia sp.]TAM32100.1 MAG: hypothetical protein EPN59_02765 [Paraburkholderia sp.]